MEVPMLTELSLKNFRLFEAFKIDHLARVNLIVGKNNVGKSTLLEAVQLLVRQGSPQTLFEQLEARGEISLYEDSRRRPKGYNISHLFFGHLLKNGASLQLVAHGSSALLLNITFVRGPKQLSFFEEDEADGTLPSDDRTVSSSSHLKLDVGGNQGIEIKINVFGDLIDRRRSKIYAETVEVATQSNYITTKGVGYHSLARLWDRITLTPKEDDVIKMLQILEPDVQRISFQSRQSSNFGILIKLKGQTRPLPLGSMGDGMHRILAIAAALADSEDGYLLVDEIDTGLHYRTITDLWRLILETALECPSLCHHTQLGWHRLLF
jgi:AAA15 family ATPase/GTPase